MMFHANFYLVEVHKQGKLPAGMAMIQSFLKKNGFLRMLQA